MPCFVLHGVLLITISEYRVRIPGPCSFAVEGVWRVSRARSSAVFPVAVVFVVVGVVSLVVVCVVVVNISSSPPPCPSQRQRQRQCPLPRRNSSLLRCRLRAVFPNRIRTGLGSGTPFPPNHRDWHHHHRHHNYSADLPWSSPVPF